MSEKDELQEVVNQLHRDVMKLEMEELQDDAVTQAKEDYLAAEQRNSMLKAELQQHENDASKIKEERQLRIDQVKAEVQELLELTKKEAEEESKFTTTDPFGCSESLSETCVQRENDLQALYREIEQAEREDTEVKEKLRELQQRAPSAIPGIIRQKEEELGAIEDAWRIERRRLQSVQSELTRKQKQLSWHLNRGSYIKQRPVDPRRSGQFGQNGIVEVKEERLRIWEENLVSKFIESKGRAQEYRLQKLQVANQYQNIKKDWEEGRNGKMGELQDLDRTIGTLRTALVRESKVSKDLVNENAELKELKKGMEEEIKEKRKHHQTVIESQHKKAIAVREAETQKALEDNKKPQPRASVLQIMEGNVSGKKRFEPRN